MTGGTSNIVRIFGSRYADYGISSNGPDHDPYADAPCVDRWSLYDQDSPGPFDLAEMRDNCAQCPALELCKQGEKGITSVYDIHGFRAGKTRDERRDEFLDRVVDRTPPPDDSVFLAHFQAGLTIPEVAAETAVSEDYVKRARKRLGIKGGQGGAPGRRGPHRNRRRRQIAQENA